MLSELKASFFPGKQELLVNTALLAYNREVTAGDAGLEFSVAHIRPSVDGPLHILTLFLYSKKSVLCLFFGTKSPIPLWPWVKSGGIKPIQESTEKADFTGFFTSHSPSQRHLTTDSCV